MVVSAAPEGITTAFSSVKIMPSILFVCTGNQCRSPFAAELFKSHLKDKNLVDSWRVDSAGTWTRPGAKVPAFWHSLSFAHGINLGAHRSRSVSDCSLQDYDLIVVMEKGHKESLIVEFPFVRGKIYLLSELAGFLPYDIADPVQEDDETANEIFLDVKDCVAKAADPIIDRLKFI